MKGRKTGKGTLSVREDKAPADRADGRVRTHDISDTADLPEMSDGRPQGRRCDPGLKIPAGAEGKFRELLAIIVRLRGPDGCPWDRAQKKADIGRYLIEEAYEVLEALEGSSPENLREELGDLLFQILFLARMAEEAGEFDIADVLGGDHRQDDPPSSPCLRRRHGRRRRGGPRRTGSGSRRRWNTREHEKSLICDGIPRSLSTLAKAQRITARASEAGFDWTEYAEASWTRSRRNWPSSAPRWKRKTRNGCRTRRATFSSRWSTSAVSSAWMRSRRSAPRCGNSSTAFPILNGNWPQRGKTPKESSHGRDGPDLGGGQKNEGSP